MINKKRLIKHSNKDYFNHWLKGGEIEIRTKDKKWVIEYNPKWLLKDEYRIKVEPKDYVNIYHIRGGHDLRATPNLTMKEAKDSVTEHYLFTIKKCEFNLINKI